MTWFTRSDRDAEVFAEAIRPELMALHTPTASPELRARILGDRAAGARVILPADSPPRNSAARYLIGFVAVIAAVLVLPIYRASRDETRNAQPIALFSFLDGVARAEQPIAAPRLPAALPIHPGRIHAGRLEYRRVWRDSVGRVTKRIDATLTLAADTASATPAWRVVATDRDSANASSIARAETVLVSRADLRMLTRVVHVRPYRSWNGINIQQRVTSDSVNGRMTLDDVKGMRPIARRLPAAYAPYLSDILAPVFLGAVPLSADWQGSLTLLGWAVIPNDVLHPVELRVVGEERVSTPAGSFDCWKVAIRLGADTADYWVRKSDGVAVRGVWRSADWRGERIVTLMRDDASGQPSRSSLEEYSVDAGHSIIEFSIPFAFTRVKGRFNNWQGTVLYDRANPANSSVSVVIESNSIDTGWPHRDEHLRTNDFFDVERYPTITFRSERLRSSPAGGWIADGPLTMHGVTKNISLPIQLVGGGPKRSAESGWLILDATSTTKIARTDFGITGGAEHNSWFNAARAATMGDSVAISLELEGWLPDIAGQRSAPVEVQVARVRDNGVEAQIDRLRQTRDSAQRGRTLTGAPGPGWPGYFRGQDLTVRALTYDGKTADAVTLAGALTSLFGTWPSHLLHGYALSVAGNQREADAAFARAKAIYKPPPPSDERFKQVDEDWWQMNQVALGALERGLLRPALQVARVLTEIYPTNSRAFVTLGRALAAGGDERGAAAAYADALKLDPNETRALEWKRRLAAAR